MDEMIRRGVPIAVLQPLLDWMDSPDCTPPPIVLPPAAGNTTVTGRTLPND